MNKQIEILHERIHLMELVNDASIDCVMVFDTDLNAVYWNNMSELVTGISREEAIGQNFYSLFTGFIDNKDIDNALRHALKGRKAFVPHEKGSYKNGYHEHHFVPLKNEEGCVTGILNIVHDVAHRIKVEKELKALNKSLARKNKELKSTNAELLAFSQVTSHDLKEPLQKFYTALELLLEKEAAQLSSGGRAQLRRMQMAAQRMRLLTDDISAYCEINAEKLELSSVNLNHVLLLAISNMQEYITEHNAVVESAELPVIKGYRTLLLKLFENILDNAIKFQEKGNKPEVKIKSAALNGSELIHVDAISEMQYVRICFADNGIGFEQKEAEQIFQMFYRIQPSLHHGSGIGLTVCKKIVELHGGFITADSGENNGCTINVFLPLKA